MSVIKELINRLQTPQEESLKVPLMKAFRWWTTRLKKISYQYIFPQGIITRADWMKFVTGCHREDPLPDQEIEYVEFYVEDQPLMLSGNAVGLMSPGIFCGRN